MQDRQLWIRKIRNRNGNRRATAALAARGSRAILKGVLDDGTLVLITHYRERTRVAVHSVLDCSVENSETAGRDWRCRTIASRAALSQ
jgi:hypothetical protein